MPSPALAQQVHRRVRHLTHNPDSYAAVKERLTQLANRLYPKWSRSFHEAHSPLEAAVRLAIVGNLLDAGPKLRLDDEAVTAVFHEALTAGCIDDQDVSRALCQFSGIISVLSTPEKMRLIELLVERVIYDRANETVAITFRPTGFESILEETA